jgi:hypothetical protein
MKPTTTLVHELLAAVAAMVAAETGREVAFVVDGFAIRRPAPKLNLIERI